MSYGAGSTSGTLNPNFILKIATERPISPIESGLQAIDDRLDRLAKIQSALCDRLNPVLGPELPQTEGSGGGVVAANQSNVSDRLIYLSNRIGLIANGFDELIDRLQV